MGRQSSIFKVEKKSGIANINVSDIIIDTDKHTKTFNINSEN